MDQATNRRKYGNPGASSKEWAHLLRRGDAEAVRRVRERVAKILANGRLRVPRQEREDLEQQITAEVWQAVNRDGFDLSRGFWGFVEVVASRRTIDWLRGRREGVDPLEEPVPDHRDGPLQKALRGERFAVAARLLGSLDPGCRRLIMRRFGGELSYREIAEELGKSEGAVRVQMYRCIRRARTTLDDRVEHGRRRKDRGHGR